jgi:hypothetical protein
MRDDPEMERFVDDDAGYLRWVADHPDGYVANVERRPRAGNVLLHRATCRTINGVPTRGGPWTGPYVKWCGDRGTLEAYVRSHVGGDARPCQVCLKEDCRSG